VISSQRNLHLERYLTKKKRNSQGGPPPKTLAITFYAMSGRSLIREMRTMMQRLRKGVHRASGKTPRISKIIKVCLLLL
jgi:hypothetical protein